MLDRTAASGARCRPRSLPSVLGLLMLLPLVAGAAKPRLADDLAAIHSLQAASRWPAAESLATAVLQRLESERAPDSLGMADVLGSIVECRLHRSAARSDSLLAGQAARVLGIRTRHLPPGDLRIADAHATLASVLRLRDDREADGHAQAALEIRERGLAPDDTLIAESLDQLGMLKVTHAQFAPAADLLGREIALRLRVQGEDFPGLPRRITAWAFALREIGEIDRARAALVQAIAITDRHGKPDDLDRAVALDGLAALERQVGNLARSIDLWQEALRIARARGDDAQVLRISRNSNGAWIELGDYASSARLMETVVRAYEKSYGPADRRTLSARNSLAIAWVGLDDSLRAMRELRAVESVLAKQSGPVNPMLALCLKYQVALLQQRGDQAGALALCRRAIETVRPNAAAMWGDFMELHFAALASEVALGDTTRLEQDRRELLAVARERDLTFQSLAGRSQDERSRPPWTGPRRRSLDRSAGRGPDRARAPRGQRPLALRAPLAAALLATLGHDRPGSRPGATWPRRAPRAGLGRPRPRARPRAPRARAPPAAARSPRRHAARGSTHALARRPASLRAAAGRVLR